ncbi:MAG: phage tail protein [Thiohalomonadaceae bacterium]
MKKLESLRAHLLALPGELPIDPDDLLIFADQGRVYSAATGTNRHFELRYKANIIIQNFSCQADRLMFWLLQWLAVNQPDHAPEPITFQADLLNHESTDLSISVDLTETVRVEQTAEGIRLHHCGEPSIEAEILPAKLWTLYIHPDGQAIAQWLSDG